MKKILILLIPFLSFAQTPITNCLGNLLDFNAYGDDNNAFDCNGDFMSSPVNQGIALQNIIGLEPGDQIGAFFIHPTCGLTNVGAGVFNGGLEAFYVPVWGDDATTPQYEGAPNGANLIWLAYRPSTGEIYNLDIVWLLESGFSYGDVFTTNGLSASASTTATNIFELNCEEECDLYVAATPSNTGCDQITDGTINIEVYGGNPNVNGEYVYEWVAFNGGVVPWGQEGNQNLYDLSIGDYQVTVSDDNGCSVVSELISIDSDGAMEIEAINPEVFNGVYNLFCYDDRDIVATINFPEQGLGPYALYIDFDGPEGVNAPIPVPGADNISSGYEFSFQYPFLDNLFNANGSIAGTYTFYIFYNGCTSLPTTVTYTAPPALQITETPSDYNGYVVSCNGENDGSIEITVTGGIIDTYTYLWNDGVTTKDRDGLEAGTYTVVATDQNGCEIELEIDITEPAPLAISATWSDYTGYGVSCNGDTDGWIDVAVTGGTEVYTYLWDDGETSEDRSDLGAGTYSVTVTDENGCSVSISIEITELLPIDITLGISSFTDLLCFGDSDGILNIDVTGGTPGSNGDYSYSWIGPNGFVSNDGDISNLEAGTYTVEVFDSNGCLSAPFTFTITQPTELELEVVTVDVTNLCNGDCEQGEVGNGAFFANTIGGTGVGTYTYTWIQFTNGGIPLVPPVTLAETGPSVTGLCAGLYSVTVTDANNCTDYYGSLEIIGLDCSTGCYDAAGNFYNIGEGIVFSECEGIECEGADNWVPYIIDDCETFCDTLYIEVPVVEYITDTIVETEYIEVIITEYIDCDSGLPCTSGMGEIIDKSKTDGKIYNLLGQEIFRRDGIYIEGGEIKYRF